ncbi:MAG TPA: leucine-rich repeat domain-containing protein [Candidatus Saccharimonadales bacterium]|jgi:hypothetical protein|nr:leucine-rich repeat domain-containing protein [Candidatus Saccharimonadales bacterium]
MRSIWPFLLGLLLFVAPAAQAQSYSAPYFFAINPDNTATITGYVGNGGAVTVPETIDGILVTGIGLGFYGSEDVTSVTIPSSVTNIGEDAFLYSTNITAINVAANNPAYVSVAGVLFNEAQTQLVAFPEGNPATSYAIPDSVISIAANAFSLCANLTTVTIPNGVTSIPNDGFQGCPRLDNVVIPDSVTSIGDNAFAGCGLTNLTIANSVTNIGDLAFDGCGSLTNIALGDGLAGIQGSTFQYSGLTSITIPDSVTSIGNYAFWYSGNLSDVTIGTGITSIGIQVFSYCPSLTAINVDTNNPTFMSVGGVLIDKSQGALIQYPEANAATSYTIPNSVTSLGEWAFLDCANLRSVTIDNSVTNIGYEAFCFCYGLTNITIPNSVTGIEGEAFSDCANLASALIGNNVGSIGYAAFADCGNLTSVSMGSGVTNIGDVAFYCDGLTSVTIPSGVTSIGEDAFYSTSLTNLTIPNSVTSIGYQAFADCTNLANLTIGSGVTNIGEYAFGVCPELSAVYFKGNAPSVDATVFSGDTFTAYYLPGTTGWADFSANTGIPVVLWNPVIQASGASFGVQSNQFGFDIAGTANIPVVVEASTDLAAPVWIPLQTVVLANGSVHFTDPQWTNYPARYYRISSP